MLFPIRNEYTIRKLLPSSDGIWYTFGMRKLDQSFTDKEREACRHQGHQSMHRAISLIGDRWTLVLVYTLLSGPRRFGELLALGSVSPKTVSQRLKMLEELGFVARHAFAEIPPRVEYELTENGQA